MLAASVAINLLSTAIWEFAIAPLYRGARSLKRPPTGRGHSLLDDSVRSAGSELSRATHGSGLSRGRWAEFVTSQEVASLLHDVFAFRMDQTDPALDDIEVAFIGVWRAFLDEHNLESGYDVEQFFGQLTGACNNLLDAAIGIQAVSAHEAKSAARHKVVMARIEGLSGREKSSPPSGHELAEFERKLSEAVGTRHSTIEPPNVFEKQRVPMDTLYVTPAFGGKAFGKAAVDLPAVTATVFRRVVLGHPGAGKSTLTAKLCKDLAAPGSQLYPGGRIVTPWPIELRKYASGKSALLSVWG